jgi:outer membrane protein TolC
LRSTLSGVDVARANYYPTLTLTGALNTASTGLLGVLANPTGTLGAGVTLPFLNVREMHFNTAIARTQYEEAVVNFRKSLYTALSDVENALSDNAQLAIQGEALQRARDDSAVAEQLYEVRYRAGAIGLRLWLDAQERRRASDIAFSANRLARLQNQAVLYQTLGGGTGFPSSH